MCIIRLAAHGSNVTAHVENTLTLDEREKCSGDNRGWSTGTTANISEREGAQSCLLPHSRGEPPEKPCSQRTPHLDLLVLPAHFASRQAQRSLARFFIGCCSNWYACCFAVALGCSTCVSKYWMSPSRLDSMSLISFSNCFTWPCLKFNHGDSFGFTIHLLLTPAQRYPTISHHATLRVQWIAHRG